MRSLQQFRSHIASQNLVCSLPACLDRPQQNYNGDRSRRLCWQAWYKALSDSKRTHVRSIPWDESLFALVATARDYDQVKQIEGALRIVEWCSRYHIIALWWWTHRKCLRKVAVSISSLLLYYPCISLNLRRCKNTSKEGRRDRTSGHVVFKYFTFHQSQHFWCYRYFVNLPAAAFHIQILRNERFIAQACL